MKAIKTHIVLLVFAVTPYFSYSQTKEMECLKIFNSFVYKSLSDLSEDSIDVSSDNIKIFFAVYVSECGNIDSAAIHKSNLKDWGINETDVISSIVGEPFPCLRDYNEGIRDFYGLLPDKIIIVYNTKLLEDE